MNITQEELDRRVWYHEFNFPNGMKTNPKDKAALYHKKTWEWMEYLLNRIDFKDKTVLDIGCFDGKWSIYAEKRGAKSVLATDDISQNNNPNHDNVYLVKELYNSNIEINQHVSIYNLTSLNQKFDIILCMGVYYHLLDIFYGFTQVRHCCNPNTIIVFEGDELIENGCYAKLNFKSAGGAQQVTDPAIRMLLQSTYFEIISKDIFDQDRKIAYPVFADLPSLMMRRAFIVCKPFYGKNLMYPYFKAPFGLDQYSKEISV